MRLSGWTSRRRKRDAFLRLLRGEELDTVWHVLRVTAASLRNHRAALLAAGVVILALRLDPTTGHLSILKAVALFFATSFQFQ